MAYIHSKLANNVDFDIFVNEKDDRTTVVHAQRRITIKGRADVINPDNFSILPGDSTKVTDEELAQLKQLDSFNRLVDRGFLRIEDTHEFTGNNMAKERDASAQILDAEHAEVSETTANSEFRNQHGITGKHANRAD